MSEAPSIPANDTNDVPTPPVVAPAVPPAPDVANLNDAVTRYLNSEGPTSMLKGTMTSAVALKPDHEAALQAAAKATGVPLDAARADGDYVKRQAQVDAMGLDTLYATHPATAAFLSNPTNAAVAHDDVGTLKAVENVLQSIKQSLLPASILSGVHSGAATLLKMGSGLSSPEEDTVASMGIDTSVQDQGRRGLLDMALGQQATAKAIMGNVDRAGQAHLAKQYFTLDPAKAAYLDPMRMSSDVLQNLPTLAVLAYTARTANVAGLAAETEALAAGALPEAAAAARVTASVKAMASIGAVSQGALGYTQQSLQTQADIQALPQAELDKSPAYQKLIAAGMKPDVARIVMADQAAHNAGTMAGAADAAISTVGEGWLGKVLGEGGPLAKRVASGAASQSATMAAMGGVNQTAQNVAEQPANPDQKTFANVMEASVGGAVQGGLLGGSMAAMAGRGEHNAQAAQDALGNASSLEMLNKVATASKLNERDTSTFQGFIRDAAQQGPVQDLWLTPEGLKQSGVDPTDLIAHVPALGDQLNEAQQSGGDMRIPVEQFATLPEELSKPLLQHLKTDPTGMSAAEANEFMQSFGPELKTNVEQVLADRSAADATQASTDKVRDDLLAKLTETNRFTHDVNKAYAEQGAAFYAAQAKRMGVTPEELYAKHPVDVGAQGVEPGSLNQLVYHGTPHEFDAFNADKIGTGEGAQVYGHGLYFASKKEVATAYREALAPPDETVMIDGEAVGNKGDILRDPVGAGPRKAAAAFLSADGYDGIAERSLELSDDAKTPELQKFWSDVHDQLGELKGRTALDVNNSGRIVHAEIPEDHEFLDWDKDLTEQPDMLDRLQSAARSRAIGDGPDAATWDAFEDDLTNKDGKGVYKLLTSKDVLGMTPPEASRFLYEQGIAGIKYLDQGSRTHMAADDTHNYVVFDPDRVKITHFEQNKGEKTTTRGSYNPDTNKITLLKNADLSTYLHESGHFYIETLAKLAAEPGAPQEVKDDFAIAAKFMGHGDMAPADWLNTAVDDRREGHETFARGFEAYLMEGKAPSQTLRPLFQRFKSWLVGIYKQLSALKVELTPDVRGVFDRLLASEDQIAENEKAKSYGLMPDLQGHMTPDEWTEYQRLGAQATQDAQDSLEGRSLRDMKWLSGAKDRALAELQKSAASKRKAVQAEVTAEVMAEPVNQARTFLKHGPDDEEYEGSHKLDIEAVKELYKDTPAELQDWRKLGAGKYGMLGKDGLEPDHVAELFGFSSGDELVEKLLNEPAAAGQIKAATDQRMIERYGDLNSPAALEAAADEAVHNDARLRFVATEANALAKAAGQRKTLASAAKAFAAEIVGRLKVREIKPSRFSAAETRAAVAAEKAAGKGDLVEAATQKRNQLINGYAAKAAYEAQEEVAKAVRFFAKFQRIGTRLGMDASFRDQIDAMLERFDLKPSTTLKAIARRKSLASWYERMKEQDQEPMIPDDLLNEAYRKSYKDMSMDELRALRDTVAQIAHLGRLKNKLLAAKDARDFASTVEDMTQETEASAIGKPRDLLESNQIGDKLEAGVRGFFVMHRKFDSLIRRLGGFKDDTTLWRTLVRPKNEAADTEATRLNQSTQRLHDIFKALAPDKVRQKKFIPEIGTSLSLEGRLSVLLNWGNEVNRQRVMDGDRWTPAQVNAILKTLEPRHFAFAQALLDHINSFKDEVIAAHKRRYGVEPPMVEASPFQAIASDGSVQKMAGGYYPIKYDANRSAKAQQFDVIKEAKAAIVGSSRSYVKPGFYKARVEDVQGRPVSKSFGTAFQHINEVLHDLSWGDYLIDAKRLLANDTFANSIRSSAGPEILSSLRNSVNAMEVGDVPASGAFQKAVQYVNSGTTLAGLGWNFLVSMKHPMGLFNGAARIGPQWIGAGLKQWIGDAATLQNTVAWVHSKSEFMASRAAGRVISTDLQAVHGKVGAGLSSDISKTVIGADATNKLAAVSTAVEHSFYWMIEHGQMIADIPTWLGQYQKSMSVQDDEDFAIQQANQAVRDSQTTGGFSDLPEIQRGGPLQKLFTKFYSYFAVVYNQLAESAEETQFKGVSNVPALAGDVMLALVLPAVLGASLQRILPGGDTRDGWAAYLGKHLLGDLMGTMIGVRDIYGAFSEAKDAPAGFRLLKNTADLGIQIKAHNNPAALAKAANAEAGVLFHYPASTVQRFVTGVMALAEGQTHNPLVVMTGPAPKSR